jgi:hypothetical protein
MVGWLINDELERMWNDMDEYLGIFEDIRQERLRKAIKNLHQDSRVPAEIRTRYKIHPLHKLKALPPELPFSIMSRITNVH